MSFRDDEKRRYDLLKANLLSPAAQSNGSYAGSDRSFCLANACSSENLHEAVQAETVRPHSCPRFQD
jgi:hypothetical protein